jgi:hypothetical protein
MPSSVLYASVAMDKNGILAVAGGTGRTVTLVDTTDNNRAGSIITTTAAFASTIDGVMAAPDGSGFWVLVDNTSIVKIDTTGATVTTWPVSGWGKMSGAISPNGSTAYVFSPVYPGLIAVNLATGTTTNGPAVGNIGPLAVSPDGTFLIMATGTQSATGVIGKCSTTFTGGTQTITWASRLGVAYANAQVYSVAVSADSKMFFYGGQYGFWGYGWTSNMAVFDSPNAPGSNTTYPIEMLCVTENDGIYIAESGGTAGTARYDGVILPQARIYGFPGTTFTCDPVGTNNGQHFAEVILG